MAGLQHIASVALAAQTDQAALLVEGGIHLLGAHAGVVHHVGDDGRIDVAAARTHHQALKRGEAHGGVDTDAILHSTD
ncbi:hypothetical protein DSECCO2_461650 [anaerobic digester metagenome]